MAGRRVGVTCDDLSLVPVDGVEAGPPQCQTGRMRTPSSSSPTGVRRDRGVSLSVLVACLVPLFLVLVGFVVDSAHRASDADRKSVV